MKLKNITDFFYKYYFCLWVLCYLLGIVSTSISPAAIMGFVNILLVVGMAINSRMGAKLSVRKERLTISIYFIWVLISAVISTTVQSFSTSIKTFIYVVTPIFLVFYKADNGNEIEFWKSYLLGIVFNDVFGAICFYTKPGFFVDFLQRYSEFALTQVNHHAGFGRLVTLFGSIETGVLSAVGAVVSLWFLINKSKHEVVYVFSLMICLIALVLTQQRGPLFGFFICVFFIFLYSIRERLLKFRYLIAMVLAIIGVMIVLMNSKRTVYQWIIERISNPMSAFDERYNYQFDVLTRNNVFEWIFGRGLGSLGYFVETSTIETRVFDQMYFNMIGEIGLLGTLLFIIMTLKTFRPFLQNVKRLFAPFFIVVIILIDGLGTTITYAMSVMPVFWVSIKQLYGQNKLINQDTFHRSITVVSYD